MIRDDTLLRAEVDPVGESFVIWLESPPLLKLIPCRFLDDPVDLAFYLETYEHSRDHSPFNRRLFARRNHPGEVRVLIGKMRHIKTVNGVQSSDLSADELKTALLTDIGLSAEMVEAWEQSGALAASMQAGPPSPDPPFRIKPPSERHQ